MKARKTRMPLFQQSKALTRAANIFRKEKVLFPVKTPRLVMSRSVYDALQRQAEWKRKENVGVLLGKPEGMHAVRVMGFFQLPERLKTPTKRLRDRVGMPTGGEVATKKVDAFIKQRPLAIGFYHSHPTGDAASPGDKREIAKMQEFPSLGQKGRFHIITRLRGPTGIVSNLTGWKGKPIGYMYDEKTKTVKRVPIKIREHPR